MRLISLNTWGGAAGADALLDFIGEHRDVDIFCLQEMWYGGEHWREEGKRIMPHLEGVEGNLLQRVQAILPQHVVYFRSLFRDIYGLAIFIHRRFAVEKEGEHYVYQEPGWFSKEHPGNHARLLQYITFSTGAGKRTVLNFHGLWKPGATHGDIPERIGQSERIVEFISKLDHPFVLCGDFNLLPDTESVRIIEKAGLRNLITEYGVTSTRTSHYAKSERFADYAFVSSGIEVRDFKVLPDEVSDHSPLFLDFK